MNKQDLKSLLENIYTALTEAESSPHMTPEGPGGEAIPWEYGPDHADYQLGPRDPRPLRPGEWWEWNDTFGEWVILYTPFVPPPQPIEPVLEPGEWWHWDDTLGEWVIRPPRSWFDQTFPGFNSWRYRNTPFW